MKIKWSEIRKVGNRSSGGRSGLVFSILILVGSIVIWTRFFSPSVCAADTGDKIDCDIQHGTCTKKLSDVEITLDIQPKPVKAMQDLLFRVTFPAKQPKSNLFIDLGMPGMNMGPNRVRLTPVSSGVYEGKGIIVRCPSGRRVWYAKITVPNLGEIVFTFDVVY
jgi:hypothetical protein